jgi:glycosyltransferase involved in cell wall biosynthesis
MKTQQLKADFAVFFHSPSGGGAQRRTVTLVNGFVERGYEVDLVMVTADGPIRGDIDERVRIVELTDWCDGHRLAKLPRRVQLFLAVPMLARYLRGAPARVFLSAASHVHVPALLARRIARCTIPFVLRMSNHLTRTRRDGTRPDRRSIATFLARRLFLDAQAAIAVSKGVADDLVSAIGYPRERIETIYNPVNCENLRVRADQPLDHPWFAAGQPPVILGVGRLVRQKDFPTLVRAFARVRAQRPARLVILGRATNKKRRLALTELIRELGVSADVQIAGYVDNAAPYMRHAAMLALSSAWEGLPGVLIEALGCGCPVVSTDCPSGPSEILDGGRVGRLVPVGDDAALAEAMVATLDSPPPRGTLVARAADFGVETAVQRYIDFLHAVRSPVEQGEAGLSRDEPLPEGEPV